MASSNIEQATQEINSSLKLSKFCMNRIGVSFDRPKTTMAYVVQKITFLVSISAICYHVFSEVAYIGLKLSNYPKVEEVAPLLHTFGYGSLSIAKVFTLWYKVDVFNQLIKELVHIWPVAPLSYEAQNIKNRSLAALRIVHTGYFYINISGVWFYNLTPIVMYFYNTLQGREAEIGYVWVSWYPFDKRNPIWHVLVYIFEVFAGVTCVWIMVSTDLLFSAMASHISLLLRLLQQRLETLAGDVHKTQETYYEDLTSSIKLHQRLIRYRDDLEEAFSFVNLINIVMSSVNICCVVFTIVLLEPFLVVSNKLFLLSALIQVGMLCWYADDILHANADVASAAYNCEWYRLNPKCRRALLFVMRRSQKPIAFTAMNFTNISLVTYTSILTRSYSYFALLYTMYNDN